MALKDRLYSASKAGELIGGLSADAVNRLARDGKIKVVTQCVRGKGKTLRRYVRESELNRYIETLEDESQKEKEPKPCKRTRHPGLAREIAEAKSYV